MLLYCIQNTRNLKRYIGITAQSLAARWSGHMWAAKSGSTSALHRAMRKYGVENFVIEEVASLIPGGDYQSLLDLEKVLIAQERTKVPHGYNLTVGGEGCRGYEWSEESRARAAEAWTPERRARGADHAKRTIADPSRHTAPEVIAARKAGWTPEKRARTAAAVSALGPQSEETKAKRKAYWTPERCQERAEQRRGTKASAEACANMSAAGKTKKRVPFSAEARVRMSAAAKARPPESPETRLKKSLAQAARHAKARAVRERTQQEVLH